MLIYFNVKFVQYQQIVYMSIPHFRFFIHVNIEFLSCDINIIRITMLYFFIRHHVNNELTEL